MNKAFLCGINKYPSAPLRGCINDVENMAKFLTEDCGFAFSDIRILTDKRATTQSIIGHLEWLRDNVQSGDRLVFHYSGHGSQIATRNNSGDVDGMHDCICPVDFAFTEETSIIDDQFMELFKNIPYDVVFNWISDSCHSGGLAKSPCDGMILLPKSFPMNLDMAWRIETAKELGIPELGLAKSIEHLQGAFISGCRSDQTSADSFIDGNYCGALTYALLREFKNGDAWKTVNIDNMIVRVRDYLKMKGYSQEPQVRGLETNHPWLSI